MAIFTTINNSCIKDVFFIIYFYDNIIKKTYSDLQGC